MIKSFADKATEAVFDGKRVKRLPNEIIHRAWRKLDVLNGATRLDDLRRPPGNRLEKLKGDRTGQHSIRISDRWRICFRFSEGDAYEVEIVDYHG